MERILGILVEMWASDDWRQSRIVIGVVFTIVAIAWLALLIAPAF